MNNETNNENGKKPIKLTMRAKRWIAGIGIVGATTAGIVAGVEHGNNSPERSKPTPSASAETTPSALPSSNALLDTGEKHNIHPEQADNAAFVFTVPAGKAPINFRKEHIIKNADPEKGSDSSNIVFTVKPGEAAVMIRPVEFTDNDGNIWLGGVDIASKDQSLVWADESALNQEDVNYITQYNASTGQPTHVSAIYEAGKGFVAEHGTEVVASVYHGIPEDQAFSKYVQPNGFEAGS